MLTSLLVDLEKIQHTGGDYIKKISRTRVNERTRGNISLVLDINHVYFRYLIAEWDGLFVASFVLKSPKN